MADVPDDLTAARAMAILAGISAAVGMGSCGGSSFPDPWTISGKVSGAVSQGVTVALGGASSAATTTDATGHYSFSGLAEGLYTVTPSLGGHTFDPSSHSVTVAGTDLFGLDFMVLRNPNIVAGTVSGAVSQGVTVTLGGASSATTTTDAAGHYTFAGLLNGQYTVTPWLLGYTFTPPSRSVSLYGPDAPGMDFGATQACGIPVPTGDVTPPSVPSGLSVSRTNGTCAVWLSWSASTDDQGVAFYLVYRDGTLIGEVNATGYRSGAAPAQLTCFQVAASDCSGNVSARSTNACFRMPGPCGG